LKEEGDERDRYFEEIMTRLEAHLGRDLRPHITYCRSFAHSEFESEYSSYKGNAYGLANTLRQTAFWKPKMRSKLPGLHFAGQLTTPGPGVPPSLISGEVAARETCRYLNGLGILPQAPTQVDLSVEHEHAFRG
jgi:phytoene desaturase